MFSIVELNSARPPLDLGRWSGCRLRLHVLLQACYNPYGVRVHMMVRIGVLMIATIWILLAATLNCFFFL